MALRSTLASAVRGTAYVVGSLPPRSAPGRAAGMHRGMRAETRVTLTDTASRLISDFSWEPPETITEHQSIDAARRQMMAAAVGALIVTRGPVVSGLVTDYEIQGAARWRPSTSTDYSMGKEIQVGDVMTPWEQVERLDWQFVRTAQVGDIAAFLAGTAATHALIVEHTQQHGVWVRGMLSRARVQRQLGQLRGRPA